MNVRHDDDTANCSYARFPNAMSVSLAWGGVSR